MLNEQRIRAVLFYLSVFIFLTGLPFILSFSLGYKFDYHRLKFTKTGLIALKTQPQGAAVYLDRTLLSEKTPLSIHELLPGEYNIKIELKDYYPWIGEVNVEAGKVTKLERIILFPLRPNIKQLNKGKFSYFWIDERENSIYYADQDEWALYSSDLDGENFERLLSLPPITPAPLKFKLSKDKQRLMYFNKRQIALVDLGIDAVPPNRATLILDYPLEPIIDIFWHSDNYHLIVITGRKIEVLESDPDYRPVLLVNLERKSASFSYDVETDTLYFTDYQKAADGNFYNNLYKLELNAKPLDLQDIIRMKPHE